MLAPLRPRPVLGLVLLLVGCPLPKSDGDSSDSSTDTPPDSKPDLDSDPDSGPDTGCETPLSCFRDGDGDGFGASDDPGVSACACPEGTVETAGDCADDDPSVSPSAPELCSDGRDNDCSGLMDCEEEICSSESACAESDCSDGLDDDEDGLVDCDDDDCWGDACSASRVRLSEGQMHLRWVRLKARQSSDGTTDTYWCVGSDVRRETFVFRGSFNEVAGTLRAVTDDGWASCRWSFDNGQATFSHVRSWGDFGGVWDGTYCHESPGFDLSGSHFLPGGREGFAIEPGCGVYTSGFLPGELRVAPWTRANAPWLAGDTVWYQGAGAVTYAYSDWSGGAGSRHYAYAYSWTFPALDPGDWVEVEL